MTYPLPGIIVEPQGVSTSVAITDDAGHTATVYADAFAVTTVTMPDTITARKTYYLPGEGPWTVTPTANGEVTAATTLTLEGSQVATVTVGGAFNASQWSALSGAYGTVLPANGATDGTAINNALLLGSVKLKPGETFVLDTAVVIPSNRELDVSGATLTRGSSYTSGPLIVNSAYYAQRTVTDGAMTSGTNVLTSATANFTPADLNRMVNVAGAGTDHQSNVCPLYAQITTVTDSTMVSLSLPGTNGGSPANAQATVSAASTSIYNRDTSIGLTAAITSRIEIGSNNAPAGTAADPIGVLAAGVLFRRVDGLDLDMGLATVTATKATSHFKIGDVTDLNCDGFIFDSSAPSTDGIHLTGPVNRFSITNVHGVTGDDFVAATMSDWVGLNDVQGNIQNGIVSQLFPNGGNTDSGFKLISGTYSGGGRTTADSIDIEDIYGTVNRYGVVFADDTTGGFQGSALAIRNVNAAVPAGNPLINIGITAATTTDLTIENVWFNSPSGTGPGYTQANQQPVIFLGINAGIVVVRGVYHLGGDYLDFIQVTGGNIAKLIVENVATSKTYNPKGCNVVALWGGLQNEVSVKGIHFYGNNSAGQSTIIGGFSWAPQQVLVDDYSVQNCYAIVAGEATAFSSGSGTTSADITVRDGYANQVNYGIWSNLPAAVARLRGCDFQGGSGDTLAANHYTGTLRVLAADDVVVGAGPATVTKLSTGAVSVDGKSVPVDISILTASDGDVANNSNSGLSCGTGPAIFHTGGTGNGWKNLYSGATY